MNENKRMYIIIGIIALLMIIIGINIVTTNIKNNKIYNSFEEKFNSKEPQVIFLGRPTCYYCQLTTPIMDDLTSKYDFSYEYIDTDQINSKTLSKILGKLNVSLEDFGTPYIVIAKEGKILATQSGYKEKADMFKMFQENGFIDASEEYKEIINYVDYNNYKSIIASDKPQLMVMVQTGCSACISAKPVLEELSEEYEITINALNITNLSDEEKTSLNSTLEYLNANDWGTPLLLVVKNNQVVDASSGYLDKATYETFLRKNGFIE